MNDKQINTFLLILTFAILLIVLEVGIRTNYSLSPELYYLLKNYPGDRKDKMLNFYFEPNSIRDHYGINTYVNSIGIRDKEYTKKKPPNVTRIAIIGDSFTFGYGVENDSDVYSEVLEKKLGDNYEVINFGMGSLNALDIYYVVKEKIIPYNPDVIIYGYFHNDPEFRKDEIHVPIQYCFQDSNIFYSYYWINARLHNLKYNLFSQEDAYYDYVKFIHSDDSIEQQCMKNIIYNYDKVAKNTTFIIFVIPEEHESFITNIVENRIEHLTEGTNIHFLSISGEFWNITQSREKGYYKVDYPRDQHFNEKGHELIADILYRKLQGKMVNVSRQ